MSDIPSCVALIKKSDISDVFTSLNVNLIINLFLLIFPRFSFSL